MDPAESVDAGIVTLRRWDPAWVEDLDEAIRASLPELKRFMPWATDDHGLQESRGYVVKSVGEWDARENWNYAMFSADERVIGSCRLMTGMGPGVLEIGYWVRTDHSGRGYATAAGTALAKVGLRVAGIERVAIKHDLANTASGRVAAKAGFTQVAQIETEPQAAGETGIQLLWERRLAADPL